MHGIATSKVAVETGYGRVQISAYLLHREEDPIIAGRDANKMMRSFMVEHATGLHRELEVLVAAGSLTGEALGATAVLPAKLFGLEDCRVI